jgi:hypothetical protein
MVDCAIDLMSANRTAGRAGHAMARKPQKRSAATLVTGGPAQNHIRACDTPQNHLVLERCRGAPASTR